LLKKEKNATPLMLRGGVFNSTVKGGVGLTKEWEKKQTK